MADILDIGNELTSFDGDERMYAADDPTGTPADAWFRVDRLGTLFSALSGGAAYGTNNLGTLGATPSISYDDGYYQYGTVSGTAPTISFADWPASGSLAAIIVELTNGGSETITWAAAVDWEGGSAPTLTAAGVDLLGFYTRDGGTTIHGIALSLDSQ